MMSLLGTDPAVAFDRVYPFENRHLTYLAKLSLLTDRRASTPGFTDVQMRDFDDNAFGPPTWQLQANLDLLPHLWEAASAKSAPATFYAEKAPTWVSPLVSSFVSPFNIFLFRDPRDIFLSANAFMKKRNDASGFGRAIGDSDEDHVRTICFNWLRYFETWQRAKSDPCTLMVRYEDFAQSPDSVAHQINQRIGLNVNAAAIANFESHRTSTTHAASVGRHLSEDLPDNLRQLFAALIDGPHATSLPAEPFAAGDFRELWLSARTTAGNRCSVSWRRTGETFSDEHAVHANYVPGSHWRMFRFKLAAHPAWTGTIAELRMEMDGNAEVSWFRLID